MKLITGGTGLIGSHILLKLTAHEELVKATYRSASSIAKTKTLFEKYGKAHQFNRINWVEANLMDYQSLADAFEDITEVFHCAAFVSFDQSDEKILFDTNIKGTANMVNLALNFNIQKFCYISSVAALGNRKKGELISEESNWVLDKNTSAYSISKFYGENEVWRGIEEGLNAVIVNPTTVIGYGEGEESSKIILSQVKKGLHFYPPGGTGFVSAMDVAELSIQLMNSAISNDRFIACSENWSFKKLFDHLAEGLGVKSPNKLAPYYLAKIAMRLEQFLSFLLNRRPKMNPVTLRSAYTTRAYDNSKIKEALSSFTFTPLKEAIADICEKEQTTLL